MDSESPTAEELKAVEALEAANSTPVAEDGQDNDVKESVDEEAAPSAMTGARQLLKTIDSNPEKKAVVDKLEEQFSAELDAMFINADKTDAKAVAVWRRETIVRFCVARQFHEEKTAEMLTAHFAYRAEHLPIEFTEEMRADFHKGRFFFRGRDKDNRPIVTMLGRNFNPNDRDLKVAVDSVSWFFDSMERSSLRTDVYQITMLYDRTGFSLKNFDKDLLKEVAGLLTNHAPERLHRVLIYPTGWLFRRLYGIVKYFFDENTRRKIIPLSSKEKFLKYVEKEQLLKSFGGLDDYEFSTESMDEQLEMMINVQKVEKQRQVEREAAAAEAFIEDEVDDMD